MSGTVKFSTSSSPSDLDQIVQLLKEIISVQERHTSMLKQMLDAATKPLDEPSPTALALQALVASTNGQTTAIRALAGTMQDLPSQISAAMKVEVDRAMTEF